MIWIWRRKFFSHSYHERSIQSTKKLFSTLTLTENFFFSFGQTWGKTISIAPIIIILSETKNFFSNLKFCTLFRKTLNFCISLILEKKERRIYAESYAYNVYIVHTYLCICTFFMSAYMPEVSLSFITMWMNLKVRCPLQDVSTLKMRKFSGSNIKKNFFFE